MRHRRTTRSHRTTLGALAIVGTLALAACGDDDGGETLFDDESSDTEESDSDDSESDSSDVDPEDVERDEFGVGLYNAGGDGDDEDSQSGDGDRITLPVGYEVGQSAKTTADMTIGFDLDAGGMDQELEFTMEMQMSEEVVDVAEDGTATVESSIDAIEIIDAPAEIPQSEFDAQFEGVIGKVVVIEYSESGMQVGEAELKDGGSLPPEFADTFDQAVGVEAFPSEPIGVGARWSSIDEVESEGLTVEGETFYELVELTEDGYVIEISQDIPVDESVQGIDMTGDFTATGEIRGNRSNPLQIDMTYDQQGQFDMSGDGESGSMNSSIVIDMTAE